MRKHRVSHKVSSMLLRLLVLSACALTLVTARPAAATTIYFNDFQGLSAAGPEWSKPLISTIGSQTFLGPFASKNNWETETLTLNNLPTHTYLNLSFDLYIIASWDGNDTSVGPDGFRVSAGGLTLLDTTFSNRSSGLQAFCGADSAGNYITGNCPRYTGAAAINKLGSSVDGDSRYHLSFNFLDSASSLVLNFSSHVTGSDETFALDNVRLETGNAAIPSPEPATLLLLGSGLAGLGAWRRMRKAI